MSGKRNLILTNGETYHVLNRSIASEEIFINRRELSRALNLIDYYRFPQKLSFSKFKKLSIETRSNYISEIKRKYKAFVEIYTFAFMPDHYHLLLKQIQDNGIRTFASNFQNGFAKYHNLKNKRDGSLFKSPFRTKWISSDEVFLHVSRYIHLNPVTSYLIEYKDLETYPWTSYPFYLGGLKSDMLNSEFLLKIAGEKDNYGKFVSNQVDYQRRLKKIKSLLLV